MKRIRAIRIIILLLMCISINLSAQISYEVRAGANLNAQNSLLYSPINGGDNTPYKLGHQAGLLINLSGNHKLDYQTGIEYINKKSSYERQNFSYGEPGIGDITESSLHYLEIPFCAIYEIRELNFLYGVYTAFGLSGNKRYTDSNGTSEVKLSPSYSKKPIDDENNYFRGLDIGLRIGATYEISSLRFYLLYSYGLLSTATIYEGQDPGVRPSLMHKTLSLSIGYKIN